MPEHTCRILDYSPMDQIYFVSLRKYVAPFFYASCSIVSTNLTILIQCIDNYCFVSISGVLLTNLFIDTMTFMPVRL